MVCFKLQLLTFCFDLINKKLPAYFINMSSLLRPVIYYHNSNKKNYSVTRVKHVFDKKCMRFCTSDILNTSSSIITDKIKTHSRKGFSVYLKCFFVNEYNSMCLIPNCYICSKNCCFVIHGALWTLALFGPNFAQGEGYYIRLYYYILYPCSPLILTFLIYLICVSLFALIHRLHSYCLLLPPH